MHARIQKVLSEGSDSDSVLFCIYVQLVKIPLKAGHRQPVSETPFKWRFACGPKMAEHCVLAW